jgi:hypothetical protein
MRLDNNICKIALEKNYIILMLFPFAFEILIDNSSVSISLQIITLNINLTFLMDQHFFEV